MRDWFTFALVVGSPLLFWGAPRTGWNTCALYTCRWSYALIYEDCACPCVLLSLYFVNFAGIGLDKRFRPAGYHNIRRYRCSISLIVRAMAGTASTHRDLAQDLTPNITMPSASSSPTVSDSKPTILHLGDDIRWNHDLYATLSQKFNIIRTHSIGRADFKQALQEKKWGDFVAMYRPFWNTGGEMGNWDTELMYRPPSPPLPS